MAKAIRMHETGAPDVLRLEEVEVGEPGPGQARVRHCAVGINFADTYFRTGLYPVPLPAGMGVEASGLVGGDVGVRRVEHRADAPRAVGHTDRDGTLRAGERQVEPEQRREDDRRQHCGQVPTASRFSNASTSPGAITK